jgi:hypothetical protein
VLSAEQLGNPLLCQSQHGFELSSVKRGVLPGALDLNKRGGFDHDDVGINPSIPILGISQVQAYLPLDDPYRDGGYQLAEGGRLSGPLGQPGTGIRQRNAAPGDGCSPSATVGLKHVAVDANGELAKTHRGHGSSK